MTNTPYTAFALVEQLFSLINNRNVDIAYGKCVNYLKLSFKRQLRLKATHLKDKTLLKTGY